MTEAMITTNYPFCEYGLAMVVTGLRESEIYKSIRISIDDVNYIKASVDTEYNFRTVPILFKKLEPSVLYKVIAKIEYVDGTTQIIESKYQPICSEASLPEPLNYQKTYPGGLVAERTVTLCSEQ